MTSPRPMINILVPQSRSAPNNHKYLNELLKCGVEDRLGIQVAKAHSGRVSSNNGCCQVFDGK